MCVVSLVWSSLPTCTCEYEKQPNTVMFKSNSMCMATNKFDNDFRRGSYRGWIQWTVNLVISTRRPCGSNPNTATAVSYSHSNYFVQLNVNEKKKSFYRTRKRRVTEDRKTLERMERRVWITSGVLKIKWYAFACCRVFEISARQNFLVSAKKKK